MRRCGLTLILVSLERVSPHNGAKGPSASVHAKVGASVDRVRRRRCALSLSVESSSQPTAQPNLSPTVEAQCLVRRPLREAVSVSSARHRKMSPLQVAVAVLAVCALAVSGVAADSSKYKCEYLLGVNESFVLLAVVA